MAPKTAKKPAKKKAAKKAKEAAASAPPAAGSQPGHNTKIPAANEIERCNKRVGALLESKKSANAKHMADIKGVYQEYGDRWGMSIGSVRIVLAQGAAQEAFAEMMAEADQKKREDITRLMAGCATAFGEDTAFGAWARAQASIQDEVEDDDTIKPPPAAIVTNKTGDDPATRQPKPDFEEA